MKMDLQRLQANRLCRQLPIAAQIDMVSGGTLVNGPHEEVVDGGLLVLSLGGPVEVRTAVEEASVASATRRLGVSQDAGIYDLYDGHRRRTALRLADGARALILNREAMDRLVMRHPSVGYLLAQDLARRIKRLDDGLADALELQMFVGQKQGRWLVQIKTGELYGPRQAGLVGPWALAIRDRCAHYAKNALTWVFVGYLAGIGISRAVVEMIFRLGLQQVLFNKQVDPHGLTIHIHHFNYGMIMMVVAALAAITPAGRRFTAWIGALFGFGLGTFLDEFGLVLNLNPYYYQMGSLLAMVAGGIVLFAAIPLSERLWGRRP
jgi:hypothetical protein